jgi:transcriptional regulator with XRE-family HTH domain
MDQIKIGRFIAACRKRVNLTQLQLADKLGIDLNTVRGDEWD